jgi:undecaprenyl-diphosphatase
VTRGDRELQTTQHAVVRWPIVALGWVGGLVVAWLFAMYVKSQGDWNSGLPWERSLVLGLPRPLPAWLDTILYYSPWLGTNWTLIPAALLTAWWLAYRRGRRDLGLHLAVVQVGTLVLHQSIKALTSRPRPDLVPRRGQYAQMSYPSGHTVTIIGTLFTVAIMLHRERGWRWPYAVAALVLLISSYARIYLGVHWPTDVIGGVLAGVCWLAGTLMAFKDRNS